MTKRLAESLGLPSLEEVLKNAETDKNTEDMNENILSSVENLTGKLSELGGHDHEVAMDKIHDETVQHARDIADFGYNVDHARMARILEVSATMYKIAIDAKNSKRDMQLKMIKIAQDQEKIEITKGQSNNTAITSETIENGVGAMRGDRNTILEHLKNNKD